MLLGCNVLYEYCTKHGIHPNSMLSRFKAIASIVLELSGFVSYFKIGQQIVLSISFD